MERNSFSFRIHMHSINLPTREDNVDNNYVGLIAGEQCCYSLGRKTCGNCFRLSWLLWYVQTALWNRCSNWCNCDLLICAPFILGLFRICNTVCNEIRYRCNAMLNGRRIFRLVVQWANTRWPLCLSPPLAYIEQSSFSVSVVYFCRLTSCLGVSRL